MKGRVIKYKPVAKLSGKSSSKKGGMKGGFYGLIFSITYKKSIHTTSNLGNEDWNELIVEHAKKLDEFCENSDTKGIFNVLNYSAQSGDHKFSGQIEISFRDYKKAKKIYGYDEIIKKLIILIKYIKKSFDDYGKPPRDYDEFKAVIPEPKNSSNSSNSPNNSNSPNRSNISKYSYKEFLTYLHQELEKE